MVVMLGGGRCGQEKSYMKIPVCAKKNMFVQITFPAKSTTAGLPGYYFQYIYIIYIYIL